MYIVRHQLGVFITSSGISSFTLKLYVVSNKPFPTYNKFAADDFVNTKAKIEKFFLKESTV